MGLKVAVWGTGNVGRPAIRAVLSHRDMELAAVIVADPAKVGWDAGALAGLPPIGVIATDDWRAVLSNKPDALVYAATADTRAEAAGRDLSACLEAGVNVVSTAFYAFLHPSSTPEKLLQPIQSTCAASGASLLVSGIDPGWVMDTLPVLLSGAVSDIREIRCREIFNYALYDQPVVVREVIGFGEPMNTLPLMLHDFAIEMVWAPMVRLLGDALGKPVDRIETAVERRTLGAFRFELRGYHGDSALYVVEHVTRIDDRCAPDWPYPPEGQGCHQVLLRGNPDLTVSVHAEDPFEHGPAGGGNATAANWIVNAIPAVVGAAPGVVTTQDLPAITGAGQLGGR